MYIRTGDMVTISAVLAVALLHAIDAVGAQRAWILAGGPGVPAGTREQPCHWVARSVTCNIVFYHFLLNVISDLKQIVILTLYKQSYISLHLYRVLGEVGGWLAKED